MKIRLAAALAVIPPLVSLPLATQAHTNYSTFYPLEWPVGSNVNYKIDDNVPTGSVRTSIEAGLANWSDLASGRGPAFTLTGEVAGNNDFEACDNTFNKIYFTEDLATALNEGDAPETLLGVVDLCYGPPPLQSITKFQISFERTPEINGANGTWYSGAQEVPNNQWDLRSIVTHEAGHATGFLGHFTDAEACPNPLTTEWETMCYGTGLLIGTRILRTLDNHDLHTIGSAY
ncbi:MAG TPA: hypothetical protein VFK52_03740 [Nocardioidaceae bacterium]|nr:hypothetical protein [Nocardioidaceae bacterium]